MSERRLGLMEGSHALKDRKPIDTVTLMATLLASMILILSLIPTNDVYSTTDEDEEEDGTDDVASEGQGGEATVTIDPASLDSLSILSHRVSTDEIFDDPTMDIDGEVQNIGTETLDFVKVTATFYDQTNSILGSDFTYTEPYTLEPGQTAPFKVSAGFGDNLPVDDMVSVKLHVDGE